MNNYQIIEKEGRINNPCNHTFDECNGITHFCKEEYIPKYIVQSICDYPDQLDFYSMLKDPYCHKDGYTYKQIKDLKEFNNLEEARKYKRQLELKDGIVIE